MTLRNTFIIWIGKAVLKIAKMFSLGSGSTWPGHIALKCNKNFIKEVLRNTSTKIILIVGTNGKTTTSTLLKYLLEKNGNSVFQNEEGANLLNGVASTLIKKATVTGSIQQEYAIFEIDENTLQLILKQFSPAVIIVLNLFRDQLDRYGEVNTIARNWHESFKALPPNVKLILNGDDPQITFLGKDTKAAVSYFGLEESSMKKKDIPHDVDSVYCPNCGEKLQYLVMSYSHLGNFICSNCGFKREKVVTYAKKYLNSSLKGVYNHYNISAVFLCINVLLGLKSALLSHYTALFKPAFGRQEVISYKNRKFFLVLSKNPTGFNQSIEAVKESISEKNKSTFLVLLNDRIPDGKDVSWIWDVEFQNILPLAKQILVSGDRAYDMALRFKYSFNSAAKVEEINGKLKLNTIVVFDLFSKAIEESVLTTSKNETIYVLATYSAMLETREVLLGKKLL